VTQIGSATKTGLLAASCALIRVRGWYVCAVEPVLSRAASDEPVRVRRHGCRFTLDLRDYVQRRIYCRAQASRELRYVRRWCGTGDTMLDIGANIGLFALVGCDSVGSAGRVVAVEPIPSSYAQLVRHAELNGFTGILDARQLALGATTGTLALGRTVDASDSGSISATGSTDVVTVPMTTLDDLAGDLLAAGNPVRLMKIDVEGFEAEVLRGGRELLSGRTAPERILLEFNEVALHRGGSSGEEVAALLDEYGYTLCRASWSGRLKPFIPLSAGDAARGISAAEATGGRLAARLRRLYWADRLLADAVAVRRAEDSGRRARRWSRIPAARGSADRNVLS
jgi:FkbM family methyltransferase